MENRNELDLKIQEMARRIKELRELENISVAEMAKKCDISEEEYLACERGEGDLNFAFLYRCASIFGVKGSGDIVGT